MVTNYVLEADVTGFAADIREIGARMRRKLGRRDIEHLKKIELFGRLATIAGLLTACIIPNPISAFLIAQGMIVRFTIGHHIGHGAYDHIDGVPQKYTSKFFARGWRRFIDWPEWWPHRAWLHLHNRLHHTNTQDRDDADLMNPDHFRQYWLPIRYLLLIFFTMTWKFTFYAPYLEREWLRHRRGVPRTGNYKFRPADIIDFTDRDNRSLWLRHYLPYLSYRFAVPPLVFLPFGATVAINILITMIMAELIHNAQTFICIRSSHSASDLPIFESKTNDGNEFYLRQVLATANYSGRGDIMDILHGWTNYQVEHHLWPTGTLLQFQESRAGVIAACQARNIKYIQENVLKRYWMMSRIFLALDYQRMLTIKDRGLS